MQKSKRDAYLDKYGDAGVYSDLDYGAPVVSIGIYAALHAGREFQQGTKVLCVGCGNGYEVIAHLNNGKNAYGTELHLIRDVPILRNRIVKAMCPNLPFRDKVRVSAVLRGTRTYTGRGNYSVHGRMYQGRRERPVYRGPEGRPTMAHAH